MLSHRRIAALPLLVLFVFALSAFQLACALFTPAATPTLAPTATLPPTETATLVPTHTVTPTCTATPDRTATMAVLSTRDAVRQLEKIAPDLEKLGGSTSQGYLGWISDKPIEMTVTEYGQFQYHPVVDTPVSDFIMQVDVKWNTSSGLSGCEIFYRADKDMENGAYYRFPIMRLQAAPAWDLEYFKFNQWQETLTFGKVQFTNFINDKNDDTNRLALVVRGTSMTTYINGEKLMTVDHKKLTDGRILLSTWQESGKTTCSFGDGWVWVLK